MGAGVVEFLFGRPLSSELETNKSVKARLCSAKPRFWTQPLNLNPQPQNLNPQPQTLQDVFGSVWSFIDQSS